MVETFSDYFLNDNSAHEISKEIKDEFAKYLEELKKPKKGFVDK